MDVVVHSDDSAFSSPTLLPPRIAKLVSAVSRSSTISLRLGTYMFETLLNSARLGTLTSIDVSKRAVERLVFMAEEDVPDGGIFTHMGVSVIHKSTTLAQLFASASFHLATSTLSTASNLAQDSVHVIDSIFGSTESSRAIASIIALIRRELGDGAGLYALVSGLTCFSILQSRGWRRTARNIEMRVLWDVVVLDTGETRTLENKNSQVGLYDESSVLGNISPDDHVIISTEEVTTKTTTVEVIGTTAENSKVTIPENAVVVEEEVDNREGESSRYKVMFQSISRRCNRKQGSGNEFSESASIGSSVTNGGQLPSQSDARIYELNDNLDKTSDIASDISPGSQIQSFSNVIGTRAPDSLSQNTYTPSIITSVETEMSNGDESIIDDNDMLIEPDGCNSPVRSIHYDECTFTPDYVGKDPERVISRRVSKSIKSADNQTSKRLSTSTIPTFNAPGKPKLPRRGSSAGTSGPSTPYHQRSSHNVLSHKTSSGDLQQGSSSSTSSPIMARPNGTSSGSVRRRSSSIYTLKTTQSQTSLVLDASETPQMQSFPPGHVCSNLAKYMRFASASYGQSFMRLLGLGLKDRMFPTSDSHHVEHHAFAHHTGVGLDHILLSSFTDSAIDKSGGISLVHFVAVDHASKIVVLTIRGTLGLEDVLTDLTCEYQDFEWLGKIYKAHRGMLRSAMLLKRKSSRVLMTIKVALEELGPDYGLVICGHSLGGSVAALLSILLSEPGPGGEYYTSSSSNLPPGRKIHSYAFGPPATMSSDLRKLTMGLTTSVVYGLDIVPCLSLGALRDLQNVALAFKSEKRGLVDQIRRRVLSKLASPNGVLFDAQDDEYLWSELEKLRACMNNEKLVPPGELYHVTTSEVFETHDGRTRKATRVVGRVIIDVDKRFGEPIFGRGIFHHSPVYYERALDVLERGICEGQIDDGLFKKEQG
ncbi:hypothetical protein V1511DRAFT_48164 [Dipodascopsis uninucleata]